MFLDMYSSMPPTHHDVTEYNVHPFPLSDANLVNCSLTTSGKVHFGHERALNHFGFYAAFILRKDHTTNQPYIQSVTYRLNHKPDNATLQI